MFIWHAVISYLLLLGVIWLNNNTTQQPLHVEAELDSRYQAFDPQHFDNT
jgi:hypothetical protein